jgi:hypothetical protein
MGTFSLWLQAGIWDLCPGTIISDTLFCVKSLLADKAEIKRGPLTSAGLSASGLPERSLRSSLLEAVKYSLENLLKIVALHCSSSVCFQTLHMSLPSVVWGIGRVPWRCAYFLCIH